MFGLIFGKIEPHINDAIKLAHLIQRQIIFCSGDIAFTDFFAFIAGHPHMRLRGIDALVNQLSSSVARAGKMQFILDSLEEFRRLFERRLIVSG